MDGTPEPKETCEHEYAEDVEDDWAWCGECQTVLEIHWDTTCCCGPYPYYVEPKEAVKPWWVRKCEIRINEECTDIATHRVFDLEYMVDCCAPCADHADHSTIELIDGGDA